MDGPCREVSLDEWCNSLPKDHRVNKELRAEREKVMELDANIEEYEEALGLTVGEKHEDVLKAIRVIRSDALEDAAKLMETGRYMEHDNRHAKAIRTLKDGRAVTGYEKVDSDGR